MDYKKILEGVVGIINTTEKSDIGFANICSYIGENCPELAESEGERIRKELLNAFQEAEDSLYMVLTPNRRKSFIAWLEKQGEYANFLNKIQIGDKVTRNQDGVLVNLSQLNRVAKKDEKQGEQPKKHDVCDNCDQQGSCVSPCPMKLVEKQGEKDEEILILKDQIESLHAAIKALKEVHIIELEKQEWSKEDEEKMVSIFLGIETFCPSIIYGNGKEELLNWLKSRRPQNRWISVDKEVYVKEPVLAQKKDKSDQFEGIVVCCDHTLTPNVYERYMILGDIVPQKQWKPSDEQMKLLREVQQALLGKDCHNRFVNFMYELKRLREE